MWHAPGRSFQEDFIAEIAADVRAWGQKGRMDRDSELEWDPPINAAPIGVMAESGGVAVAGNFGTYEKRLMVERGARESAGARAGCQARHSSQAKRL